jgi:hypothetical protein
MLLADSAAALPEGRAGVRVNWSQRSRLPFADVFDRGSNTFRPRTAFRGSRISPVDVQGESPG